MARTTYRIKKRTFILFITSLFILLLLGGISTWIFLKNPFQKSIIKVGILHSLTGTMALSEKNVVDATLLAIQEINRRGGLLGREIFAVLADGKSDWPTFAQQAEKLIKNEKVAVIFGCWTSASRKMVKPIVEQYQCLLFYPVQYEGLEESDYIIYTGAAPNQQIIPGVNWCFDHLGTSFFLVGSDYIFPRTAHEIMKHIIASRQGSVVGEYYLPLASTQVEEVIAQIIEKKPEVILNTINGDTNVHFFKALRNAGITPEKIPCMSFSISEPELKNFDIASMIGDYAIWNYFQSIQSPTNELFVNSFQNKYGSHRVIGDPMQAAYCGVQLWARAVIQAQSVATDLVLKALGDLAYNAPAGVVHMDASNHHTWKAIRIGKIKSDGQFTIIWDSIKAVQPLPFPLYKNRAEWNLFLELLYKQWNNQWSNPTEQL